MDTNKDTKQAATSAATSTGTGIDTPGAFHTDVSPMKGKQAFQTGGPSYYPEDDEEQQLAARRLEQESASSERAAAKSRNEKAEAKLKQEGKAKKQTLLVFVFMVFYRFLAWRDSFYKRYLFPSMILSLRARPTFLEFFIYNGHGISSGVRTNCLLHCSI
jgi:hypothetical protein